MKQNTLDSSNTIELVKEVNNKLTTQEEDEKSYKSHPISIVRDCKTLLYDNHKEILHMFSQLNDEYKISEKLWGDLDDTDKKDVEDYEEAKEKCLDTIDKIGSLIVDENSFYIFYNQYDFDTSSTELVFSLFSDGLSLANTIEGSGSDFTVIIGDTKTLEICIGDDPDGFYFDFPKLDS